MLAKAQNSKHNQFDTYIPSNFKENFNIIQLQTSKVKLQVSLEWY